MKKRVQKEGMVAVAAPTDIEILDALLSNRERLSSEEEEAFQNMRFNIENCHILSSKQRQWADAVYSRLELEADRSLNLVSSGQVPRGNVPRYAWELNKPLKPPGR